MLTIWWQPPNQATTGSVSRKDATTTLGGGKGEDYAGSTDRRRQRDGSEHRAHAQSESFNVYTTDLGEEGVDLGKLYDYDIILLDLNLPDMSGYEVLRTLRLSKVKTPILILSGMAGIEDKVRGLGFGADDYMTKPFHKDELVARIHAIVRRSKGHAQSVISTGELIVNLDAKTVEVGGQRVHLTGKEYQCWSCSRCARARRSPRKCS